MRLLAVMAVTILFAGCNSETNRTAPPDQVTIVFAIRGTDNQQFTARTADTDVITSVRAQLALPEDQRAQFPNGPIARGSGQNKQWSWYFVPDEWSLTKMSIELCDGTPQMVEDNLDYWIDTVGQFCPWGAYVLEELDSE